MGNKVSFDYSKAAGFVSAHEVEYMKEAAERARAALAAKTAWETISWDGSTCLLIMTEKSSRLSKRRLKRSIPIQRFWW